MSNWVDLIVWMRLLIALVKGIINISWNSWVVWGDVSWINFVLKTIRMDMSLQIGPSHTRQLISSKQTWASHCYTLPLTISFLLFSHMIINNLSLFMSMSNSISINISIMDMKRYILICLFISMLVSKERDEIVIRIKKIVIKKRVK